MQTIYYKNVFRCKKKILPFNGKKLFILFQKNWHRLFLRRKFFFAISFPPKRSKEDWATVRLTGHVDEIHVKRTKASFIKCFIWKWYQESHITLMLCNAWVMNDKIILFNTWNTTILNHQSRMASNKSQSAFTAECTVESQMSLVLSGSQNLESVLSVFRAGTVCPLLLLNYISMHRPCHIERF